MNNFRNGMMEHLITYTHLHLGLYSLTRGNLLTISVLIWCVKYSKHQKAINYNNGTYCNVPPSSALLSTISLFCWNKVEVTSQISATQFYLQILHGNQHSAKNSFRNFSKFKFYPSVWTKISVCLLFQVHSKIFFTY